MVRLVICYLSRHSCPHATYSERARFALFRWVKKNLRNLATVLLGQGSVKARIYQMMCNIAVEYLF